MKGDKSEHKSSRSNQSGKDTGSTRGLDDIYSLDRFDYGDISLEQELITTLNDGRSFVYGSLFRFIGLIALFFLFYTFYRGLVFAIDVHFHSDDIEILPDRFHSKIDDRHLDFNNKMSDFMFYAFVAILIFRFVLFYPVIFNVQILLRFGGIYIVTYIFRGLFVFFTTVPSPYPYCSRLSKSNTWWQTYATLMFGQDKVDCAGLLFSGRAFIVFLGAIILAQNSGPIFTVLMLIYSFLTAAVIVLTKQSYSIDVMFSLVVAGTFYYYYFSRMDAYGVRLLNEINTRKYRPDEEIRYSILYKSVINKWVSTLEQIPKLIAVAYKMKLLQPLVIDNDGIHPGLVKEYKTMLYFFGLENCDDILTLYRGSKSFNFSYWKKLKVRIGKKRLLSSGVN